MRFGFIVVLIVALISAFTLTGCGAVDGVQDTDYVVYSNGGSAVQYGNYVYFINGTRGYENPDGDENVKGEAVKGGLFRTELNGTKDGSEFDIKSETSELSDITYDFVYELGEDYFENVVDVVPNVEIASKIVGTSGYANGGIFIYDDYIYFASPNNQKGKDGVVQVTYNDYYRVKVDGTGYQYIYTTEGEASDQPYAFYHAGYNSKGESIVYLVTYFDTTIASVKMEGSKVYDTIYLTEDATSCYLPTRDTFDNANLEYGLEDFVFYTRDVDLTHDSEYNDTHLTGNVIEMCTPGGDDGYKIVGDGTSTSIEDVRDGLLFYTVTTTTGDTEVKYSDFNDITREIEWYGEDKKPSSIETGTVSGTAYDLSSYSSYTTTYFFRGNTSNSTAFMLGVTSSGVYLVSDYGDYRTTKTIYDSEIEIQHVDLTENYIYFTYVSGTALYRTELFKEVTDKTDDDKEVLLTDRTMISAGITIDIVAGHVMFFADITDGEAYCWEDETYYSYFQKLTPGSESFYVGTIDEDDEEPDDWDYDDWLEEQEALAEAEAEASTDDYYEI